MGRPSKRPTLQPHVMVGDTHCPYHDPYCIELVAKVIRAVRPVGIHHLGDLHDFHALSTHERDPELRATPWEEIQSAAGVLQQLWDASPRAARHIIEGNHDARYRRYIGRVAPHLSDDPLFALANRLHPTAIFHPEWESYSVGGLYLKHGTRVSPHSAYTARLEMEAAGVPLMHGHTHRLGATYRTLYHRILGGWENGCLCEINPRVHKYTRGQPNWQNGFSVVLVDPRTSEFHVQQILILGVGKKVHCYWGSQRFGLRTLW